MVELNGKKILVTFLMNLGHLVLVTPFIHALRKAAPDAHIIFLCDEKVKDVVLHNPYLDEVITIDKKGRDSSILSLIACSRRLSEMDFDLLINLHPNERCSFICAMTKVALRVGAVHTMFRSLWNVNIQLDETIHAVDMYLDVLLELGVNNIQHDGLEIFLSDEHIKQAEDFWRNNGVFSADKVVGFNIGSAIATKRWEPKCFAQVADLLAEKGYKPVFFGGTMDEDIVEEAVAYMKTTPVVATGAFTVGALTAALRRCSLLVTNDSAPMHIAVSQKVPVVALYGPSNYKLCGPYTDKNVVITAMPHCMGCISEMKHKCNEMRCMKYISVSQVVEATEKMLLQYGDR